MCMFWGKAYRPPRPLKHSISRPHKGINTLLSASEMLNRPNLTSGPWSNLCASLRGSPTSVPAPSHPRRFPAPRRACIARADLRLTKLRSRRNSSGTHQLKPRQPGRGPPPPPRSQLHFHRGSTSLRSPALRGVKRGGTGQGGGGGRWSEAERGRGVSRRLLQTGGAGSVGGGLGGAGGGAGPKRGAGARGLGRHSRKGL